MPGVLIAVLLVVLAMLLTVASVGAAQLPGAIPGEVDTGSPSGIAQKQSDRAVLRFREKLNRPKPEFAILNDPSATLTLADILAENQRFEPIRQRGIPAQFTKNAVWLRVILRSETDLRQIMAMSPTFVEFLDVYFADGQGDLKASDFTHYALGSRRPLLGGSHAGFEDVVPLDLKADTPKRIYIHAFSPNVMMMVNVRFYQPEEYVVHNAIEATLGGIVIGCMALLMIAQLLLYRFDRNLLYLCLALSTLSAAAYHIGNLGYARLLLFPAGGRGNDIFLAFFSSFGLFAGTLTTMIAFDLHRQRNWMFWVCIFSSAVGLLSTLSIFLGLNVYTAPPRTVCIQVFTTLAAIYGLVTIRRDDWASYLRAAAFMVLWVGMSLMLLYYWNVPGLPDWASKGYAIACLLEALLLTTMLSWQLRAAQRLNASLQNQALEAAQSAEQRAVELVDIRTAELAKAKRVAEAALAAELEGQKSQIRFMEVISHQYRTPLASIRSNVDTIALDLADEDTANRLRIARIRRGIARLVEVLEVNLERSQVQGSALEPEVRPTPIGQIVRDAERRSHELMPDAEIIVELPPQAAATKLCVDAHMINLALINLLENAVKYSAPVGKRRVTLAVEIAAGDLLVSVADQGIGIPKNEIDTVLQAKVRASNVRKVKGTGMGLSLVSRIASAHGATVDIASLEGKGTVVTLVFSLAQFAENKGHS